MTKRIAITRRQRCIGAVCLAICLLTAACNNPTSTPTPTLTPAPKLPPNLVATTWGLLTLHGQPPLPDTRIELVFTADDLTGSTGCNGYGQQAGMMSDFRITASGEFQISDIAITVQACYPVVNGTPEPDDDSIMRQESDYIKTLLAATHYAITGDTLTLSDAGGTALLIYQRLSTP